MIPVFIDIDETTILSGETKPHTIEAMDKDPNHEEYCFGRIYIDGEWRNLKKIKGRGNYTWKMSDDKRAYNITLKDKINLPGFDSPETKKWSILSEIGDHSLLCNRSGFYLAHELGIGQNTASVDVWMNGEYQGCYTMTPKYDSFVTKDGYLIEEDNYQEPDVAEGGDPQFALEGLNGVINGHSSSDYNLITVKKMGDNLLLKDGIVDESPENLTAVAGTIQTWLQEAWDAIRAEDGYNPNTHKYYTEYIDIESFAKMYLMQEYVKSYDVCAGSIFFHRDGTTDDYKLIAGPIWDLDNAMGSVQNNSGLGSQKDRRSGKGDFIPNITEYKTSIYKTLYKHTDFKEEVIRQYNLHRSAFDGFEGDVKKMISDIDASARMNHYKVNDITGYNLHKYSWNNYTSDGTTTLESGTVYEQIMQPTTNSKTDWANYAANLTTYIHARSLWFKNNYYNAIITCDTGSTVTVYKTSDFSGECVENATDAIPRSSAGAIDHTGSGQINFVVNVKPGYKLEGITIESDNGAYTTLMTPDETGIPDGYRITNVKGALTIKVQTSPTEPMFKGHALVLSGEIGIMFGMDLSALSETERAASYMTFTVNDQETQVDTADATIKDGRYVFTCFVNTLQMAEEVQAVFHYGDDETVEDSFSVEDYVTYIVEHSTAFTDTTVELAKAIADYGHYAQIFLTEVNNIPENKYAAMDTWYAQSYNIDEVKTAVDGYTLTLNKGTSKVKTTAMRLSLDSETALSVRMTVEDGAELTATATLNEKTFAAEKQSDGSYVIKIVGIKASQLATPITITGNAGGEFTITVPALAYVRSILTSANYSQNLKAQNAVAALYHYYSKTDAFRKDPLNQ